MIEDCAPREIEIALASEPASDRHPALLYLADLRGADSRRTMRAALDKIAAMLVPGASHRSLPWERVEYGHCVWVRAVLARDCGLGTARKCLAALRGVLQRCEVLGLISADELRRRTSWKPVRGERVPRGRELARDEIAALLRAVRPPLPSPSELRDGAMLALMLFAGCRRAEAASARFQAYDEALATLTVLGKGDKARTIPLAPLAVALLRPWLCLRGFAPGAILCPVTQRGAVVARPMTTHALALRCVVLADRAGLEHFSPHDLRRTAASAMLRGGADLSAVGSVLGRAHTDTDEALRPPRRGRGPVGRRRDGALSRGLIRAEESSGEVALSAGRADRFGADRPRSRRPSR